MIEMPLNRAVPTSAPSPVAGDSAASDNESAFAEMLGRNLGERIVSRGRQENGESEQDAAQGGAAGGSEFYQGAVVTPWAPPPADTDLGGFAAVAGSSEAPATGQPATAAVGLIVDPTTSATTTPHATGATRLPSTPAAGGRSIPTTTSQPVVPQTPGTTPQVPAVPVSFHLDHPVGPLPAGRQHAAPILPDAGPTVATPAALTTDTAPAQVSAAPIDKTVAPQPSHGPGQPTNSTPLMAAAPSGPPTSAQPAAEIPTADTGMASQGHTEAASTVRAPAGIVSDRLAEPAAAADQNVAEVGGPQSSSTPSGVPTARPHVVVPSSLINRVLEAIEHQQSQPPPRMVVVDMPELEGLRLMVALQSDGKVHVAPMAGSAPPQIAEPFVVAVAEALAAEGFDLAKNSDDPAHSRGERDAHNNPEELPQRGRQPRSPRRSAGLRL